ncbi:glycosyltransferase [Sharpea azabuensis]|uniref:glycosyltransferase n=1 Tax=Sharpea azabuensis TaxID=322505 RepID=UPI00051C9B03|nr:glycosyltransferase [Sharpea azabuensis]
MSNEIQLSLCIPTNGILEWVKPVLDSIYSEEKPIAKFEVIVTDNGNNEKFYEFMKNYSKAHDNLIYRKTNAVQFNNQIEAFKLASGKLIKFINHRKVLLPGSLNYLLEFVEKYQSSKPFVYFLEDDNAGVYENFDSFVSGLSYFSSYSGGIAMWRDDFMKIDLNKPFNVLFPHTDMLFSARKKKQYIIDGHSITKDLPTDETKKGKYNLFFAFAVEYPSIILELYRNGDITYKTLKKVKEDNYGFLCMLYLNYIILKKPCSYDLQNYKDNLRIYYGNRLMPIEVFKTVVKKSMNLIKRKVRKHGK